MIGKKETGLEEKTLAKLTVSAVLLIFAVLFLSGLSKRGEMTYETPKFARGLQDGTYAAQKENQFSTVRVDMTIRSDRIEDCRITSSGAADLLTDEIRSAWANAIVDEQNPAPDAITGATLVFSAASVQEAVQDILAQAAGEKEAEPLPAIDEAATGTSTPDAKEPAANAGQDAAASAAAAPAPEQTAPAETDPSRLMRERPAVTSVVIPGKSEPEAQAEPEPEGPVSEPTDPARFMRERPLVTAVELPEKAEPDAQTEATPEVPAEEPETDPSRLMRERPAVTDVEVPEQAEPAAQPEIPSEEETEGAEGTADVSRFMRARP